MNEGYVPAHFFQFNLLEGNGWLRLSFRTHYECWSQRTPGGRCVFWAYRTDFRTFVRNASELHNQRLTITHQTGLVLAVGTLRRTTAARQLQLCLTRLPLAPACQGSQWWEYGENFYAVFRRLCHEWIKTLAKLFSEVR